MNEQVKQDVTRRRVFYIPGYDPIPPRRYRELYRKEAAEQARISGYAISLTPKQKGGAFGWHVHSNMHEQKAQAAIEVLVWSDIVRASMSHGIIATYLQLIRTAWEYISTGALFRLMKLRKGPVIAALYPVGILLLQAVLAVFFAFLVATVCGWLFGVVEQLLYPGRIFTPLFYPAIYIPLLIGVVACYGLLRWFKAQDGKLFAYYLMNDYAYGACHKGAYPPELEARMEEFGASIAKALSEDWDEVLVVGHSSGAHLAVSILADLIRAGRVPANGPKLAFLSLGQVVPMVSFLRDAWRLRADLAYLSVRDELFWVDVTAPGDGCAFALCDPVSVSGLASEKKRWPLVFSAQFTRSLSPERWKALRWRFFRLHFQYLCAFDAPLDYDYFRITAGPLSLSARYEARPPSASRIERAVSKYTSIAP